MGVQVVKLTWLSECGHVVEEVVALVSEAQDPLLSKIFASGMVFFEDEKGMFGLQPTQVISIEPLEV